MDRAPVREVRQVLDLLEPVSRLDRVDQLLKSANSPSPRTTKSACSSPSSGRKLTCVPPSTAIAPASLTLSASRYDWGAVEVIAEIATRSAERTSFMSTSWMSSM